MAPSGGARVASTRAPGANLAKWRTLLKNVPTAMTVNEFVNDDWWTALHIACKGGNREVGLLLLETGAAVDAQTREKCYTPLMVACYYGMPEMVYYLLAAGAATGLKDADGATALDIAVARGKPEECRATEGELGSLECAAVLSAHLQVMLPHPLCQTIEFEASLRCLLDRMAFTHQLDLTVYRQRVRKNKVAGAVRAAIAVKNAPRPRTPLSEDAAAARIQRGWRCRHARREAARLQRCILAAKAVLVLQRSFRVSRAKKELAALKAAKGDSDVDSMFADDEAVPDPQPAAAARLQACALGYAARRSCAARRGSRAACAIQACGRGHAARKHCASQRETQSRAACTIQSVFRGHVARAEAAELKAVETQHVDPQARRQSAVEVLADAGPTGRLASLCLVADAQRESSAPAADSPAQDPFQVDGLNPAAAAARGGMRRRRQKSAVDIMLDNSSGGRASLASLGKVSSAQHQQSGSVRRRSSVQSKQRRASRRVSRRQSAVEFAELEGDGERRGMGRVSSMASLNRDGASQGSHRRRSSVALLLEHSREGGLPGLGMVVEAQEQEEPLPPAVQRRMSRRASVLSMALDELERHGSIAGKPVDVQSLAQTLHSYWGSSKDDELRDLQAELEELVGLEVLERLCPSSTDSSDLSEYSSDDSLESELFSYDAAGLVDYFYDGPAASGLKNPADEAQFQHLPANSDVGAFFRRLYRETVPPGDAPSATPYFRLFLDEYYRLRGFGCAVDHKARPVRAAQIEHDVVNDTAEDEPQGPLPPPATFVELLARMTRRALRHKLATEYDLVAEDAAAAPAAFSAHAFFKTLRKGAGPPDQLPYFHLGMDQWESSLGLDGPHGLHSLVELQREARAAEAVKKERVYAAGMAEWKRVRRAARLTLQCAARCLIAKCRIAVLAAARAEEYRIEDEAAAAEETLTATLALQRLGGGLRGRLDARNVQRVHFKALHDQHVKAVALEKDMKAARNAHVESLNKVDKQAFYLQEQRDLLLVHHRIRVLEIQEEIASGRGESGRECFWTAAAAQVQALSVVKEEVLARERLAMQYIESSARAQQRYERRLKIIGLFFFVRLQLAQRHFRERGELFQEIRRVHYYFFEEQDRHRIGVRALMNADRFSIYFACIVERETLVRSELHDEEDDLRAALKHQEQLELQVRQLEQEQREHYEALFNEEDDARQDVFSHIASDFEILARYADVYMHEALGREEVEEAFNEPYERWQLGNEQWDAREAATFARCVDHDAIERGWIATEETHAHDTTMFLHGHFVETAALVDSLMDKRTKLLGMKFLPPLEAMIRRQMFKEERWVREVESHPFLALTRSCEVWYEEREAYLDTCYAALTTIDAAAREECDGAWYSDLAAMVTSSEVFPEIQRHERKCFLEREAAEYAAMAEAEAAGAEELVAINAMLRQLHDDVVACVGDELYERGVIMQTPQRDVIFEEERALRIMQCTKLGDDLLAMTLEEEADKRPNVTATEAEAWEDFLFTEAQEGEAAGRRHVAHLDDEWAIEAEIYYSNLGATADAICSLFDTEPLGRKTTSREEDLAWGALDALFILQRREIVDRQSTHEQHDAWYEYFMSNLDRPPMRPEMIRHLAVVIYGSYLYRAYYTRLQKYAAKQIRGKKKAAVLLVGSTLTTLDRFYGKLCVHRRRERGYRAVCRRNPQTVQTYRPLVTAYFRKLRWWRGLVQQRRRWPGLTLLEDSVAAAAAKEAEAAAQAAAAAAATSDMNGTPRQPSRLTGKRRKVAVQAFRNRGTGPHDPAIGTPRHGNLVRKDPQIGRTLLVSPDGVVVMIEKRRGSRLGRRGLAINPLADKEKTDYSKGRGLALMAAAAAEAPTPVDVTTPVASLASHRSPKRGGYHGRGAPSSAASSPMSRRPFASVQNTPTVSARSAPGRRPPLAPPVGKQVNIAAPKKADLRKASDASQRTYITAESGLSIPRPQLLQDHLGHTGARRERAASRVSEASAPTPSTARSVNAFKGRERSTSSARAPPPPQQQQRRAASSSPQRVWAERQHVAPIESRPPPPPPVTAPEVPEPELGVYPRPLVRLAPEPAHPTPVDPPCMGEGSPSAHRSVAVQDLLALDVDEGADDVATSPRDAASAATADSPQVVPVRRQRGYASRAAVPADASDDDASPVSLAAMAALRALATDKVTPPPPALPPLRRAEAPEPLHYEPPADHYPVASPPLAPLGPLRRNVSPRPHDIHDAPQAATAPQPAAGSAVPAALAYNRLGQMPFEAGAAHAATQPGRLGTHEADAWLQWGGPGGADSPKLARPWEAQLPWEGRAQPPPPPERGDFRVMLNPLPKRPGRPGALQAAQKQHPPRKNRLLPPVEAEEPGALSSLAMQALENLQQRHAAVGMLQPLQVAAEEVMHSFDPPARPDFGLNATYYGAPTFLDTA